MAKAKKAETKAEETKHTTLPCALLGDNHVLLENSNESRELYNSSRFGELDSNGAIQLSMIEALYLAEKGKIRIVNDRNKEVPYAKLLQKAKKSQKGLWTKYVVFRDMRNRGYLVKTALKFGADFRVYDRGVKPGEDHAKWVLFPIHESQTLTWHDFAAKNRVAHGTKKKLLLGIVDDEGEVTYFENSWVRP